MYRNDRTLAKKIIKVSLYESGHHNHHHHQH